MPGLAFGLAFHFYVAGDVTAPVDPGYILETDFSEPNFHEAWVFW